MPLQDDSKPQAKDFDVRLDSNSNLSTSFRHQSLGKETKTGASLKKKKSKSKRNKSKLKLQSSDGVSKRVNGKHKPTVKNGEKLSLATSEDCSTPRRSTGKEQCKVINLKIPLLSDINFRHSHYYNLQEEQEHLKATMRVEESSPGTPRSKKKSYGSSNPPEGDGSHQSQDKGTSLSKLMIPRGHVLVMQFIFFDCL